MDLLLLLLLLLVAHGHTDLLKGRVTESVDITGAHSGLQGRGATPGGGGYISDHTLPGSLRL